eukprot:219227-Pyramimonas_sp.AAC.1
MKRSLDTRGRDTFREAGRARRRRRSVLSHRAGRFGASRDNDNVDRNFLGIILDLLGALFG